MKKIVLVAIMALVSVAASAQVYVGGGLGAAFVSRTPKGGESVSSTQLSLAPEVGYYFTDKFAVGAQFKFGMDKTQGFDAAYTTAELGYVRYDFLETGSFRLGAEIAAGYQSLGNNRGGYFAASLRPVGQFAVSDKLSVVTRFDLVSYAKYNEKAGSASVFGLAIANGGSVAEIGVSYKF